MREGEGSTIESQTRIRGRIAAQEPLRIRGRVDGRVEGQLVLVEAGGVVVGDVDADEVRVDGVVLGRIEARGRVWLGATAQIRGAIAAPRLAADVGARVDAEMFVGDVGEIPEPSERPVETSRPSLSAVPAPDGPRVVVVKKRS